MTDPRAARMSERELYGYIDAALDAFGWRWVRFRPARKSRDRRTGKERWVTPLAGHPGPPDYYAVRDGMILYIECKTEKGKLTPVQEEWRAALQDVSCSVCGAVGYAVIRPSDWLSGRVVELLK